MQLTINNQVYEVAADPDDMLLWVIRDTLGLTGTKYGCGAGICGSCTIHLDGAALRSCITPASAAEGKAITTIEGLAMLSDDGEEVLHPVQQAFIETQTPQCSWCMSGQMMTAAAFLENNPQPTDAEIEAAMNNNICRCGCYARIRAAVARAAEIAQEGAA
ncbi:MAG: (2Fe-2S)-binding protein [Anaerolineae bacterium]|nr:(2Fe-2S)-binding protein [Anaerolineae bacterium]NUQ04611.1 (2Fe-2S)-binding protein [Anaerolineae bacterium]